MTSKDQVAKDLIHWHFRVEPGLREVYRIMGEQEGRAGEPIKLLEVNAASITTGSVDSFAFAPTADVPFPTVIVELSPEEFEAVRRRPEMLPGGWSLDCAERFLRPTAA
ncbi:MAG: hypothetical protein HY744_27485 [Deltaproteobacteria bacterium]|nr:hypothetical protein [Deltaproteobacteria bacterium]